MLMNGLFGWNHRQEELRQQKIKRHWFYWTVSQEMMDYTEDEPEAPLPPEDLVAEEVEV